MKFSQEQINDTIIPKMNMSNKSILNKTIGDQLMNETYQSYKGDTFIFHLFDEKDTIRIGLSSSLVYPSVNRDELKGLADFILQYLENN